MGEYFQPASIFKVRLGLGEIEGKNREIEWQRKREIETELTNQIPSKAGSPN